MYPPLEDSFLLAEQVKIYLSKLKNKNIKILDVGSGTGIQAKTCLDAGIKNSNILCIDLDKESIEYLKTKKFNAILSDLFDLVKEKFDLIIFNPPYLPEHKFDKGIDTTGGKKGDEIILKFLKQAKSHLTKEGKILLLLSSLTPRERINAELKKSKMKMQKLAEKKMFMETLEIFLIK